MEVSGDLQSCRPSEAKDNRERVLLDVCPSSNGGGLVLWMRVPQASASDNIILEKKKLNSKRDYCKIKMTKTQRVPERVLYFIFVKDPLNTEHIFV
jgi:hypothetical protein